MNYYVKVTTLCILTFLIIISPVYISEKSREDKEQAEQLSEQLCIDVHNTDKYKFLNKTTYCNIGGYTEQQWVKMKEK